MVDRDFDRKHPRHPAKAPGSKGGQFAEVPDGGAGNYDDWASQLMGRVPYKRGRWSQSSVPDPVPWQRAVRKVLTEKGLTPEEVQDAIDGIQIDPPDTTLTNGPHMIQDYVGLPPELLQGFSEMVDDLYAQYKPADGGPINIAVVPPEGMTSFNPAEPNKVPAGETIGGTGIMWLNVQSFLSPPQGTFWMPVGQYVNPMIYVVAHEWGHVIDDDPDAQKPGRQEFFERVQREIPMSVYGASSPAEAYAEAFAEWFLTTGEPFHPAAAEYAKQFGWPKPRSQHGT